MTQIAPAAITRFSGTACPFADRILKVSLLLPAGKSLMNSLNPLAEVTEKSLIDADAGGDIFQASWRSVSLALFEYRRGDNAMAIEWCRRCLAYPEYNAPRTATARVILAMACHRLGQLEEARSQLAQAREVIDTKFRSGLDRGSGVHGFWFDWVFARILLNQAEQIILTTQ